MVVTKKNKRMMNFEGHDPVIYLSKGNGRKMKFLMQKNFVGKFFYKKNHVSYTIKDSFTWYEKTGKIIIAKMILYESVFNQYSQKKVYISLRTGEKGRENAGSSDGIFGRKREAYGKACGNKKSDREKRNAASAPRAGGDERLLSCTSM